MDTIWQDIRYAARMLAKKPGFTAVAVLSLGLGIGANTTIFTLVKAVFLQSVPVKDPSRVVAFFSDAQNKNGLTQYLGSSYLNLKDYREKNDVFSGLSIAMGTGAELDISGTQIGVFAELVNWDFFDIVGVHPSIGRGFLPEEDQTPGAHPVVVLSHAIWNRQFGANPKLIGQTIRVSNQDYTVIGVMPEQFHDVGQLGSPEMLIPIMMHDQILTGPSKEYFFWRRFRMAPAVARLKPGITLARAEAAMRLLGDELEKEYPNDNGGRNNMMVPFDQTNIPPQQRSVFLLAGTLMMSIVGLVLLIACANVANLLLTRATQRRRELAVRLSLGASRARLIRQLLTESLLLGLVACGAGVLIGHWLERLILGLWPGGPPPNLDFTMDLRVLGFTVALSLVATMIFGLVPALQASKPSQMASLRDRSDAPAGSTHWYGLRGVLVMTQVALSLIALVGAGLFVHSMRNAQNVDPGFEVKHEMVLLLNVGNAHYTQAHRRTVLLRRRQREKRGEALRRSLPISLPASTQLRRKPRAAEPTLAGRRRVSSYRLTRGAARSWGPRASPAAPVASTQSGPQTPGAGRC